MAAITADARMPAVCTVYRWMQVVPAFGDAVRMLKEGVHDRPGRAAFVGRFVGSFDLPGDLAFADDHAIQAGRNAE